MVSKTEHVWSREHIFFCSVQGFWHFSEIQANWDEQSASTLHSGRDDGVRSIMHSSYGFPIVL